MPEPTRRQLLAAAIDRRLREGTLLEIEEGPLRGEVLLLPFRSSGEPERARVGKRDFRHEPVRLPRAFQEAVERYAEFPELPPRRRDSRRVLTAEEQRRRFARRQRLNAWLAIKKPTNRKRKEADDQLA